MGVIYLIKNKVNNKIYVGKRIFTKKKFLESNYYGSGILIKNAIKKYGINNFDRILLEEIDNKLLSSRERFWIKELKSNDSKIGYNQTSGGENEIGFTHSEETKLKIGKANSISLLGNKISQSARDKISKKLIGIKRSEYTKKKMSESKLGKKHSDIHRLHNSLSKIGRKHTEEEKKKIGKSVKKWHDEIGYTNEQIEMFRKKANERYKKDNSIKLKISKTLMGHTVSEETKKKISESVKRSIDERRKKIGNNKSNKGN